MHISDYVKQQQKSFKEEPFNPLDSLVLSSLSYLNFESCYTDNIEGVPEVLLSDVIQLSDTKQLTKGFWIETSSRTPDFFEGLITSKRYEGTRVGLYVNEVSVREDKQFSATTLILPDEVAYLSFRGTDLSYSGWKEDFDLAYKSVVPSQAAACDYATRVSELLPNTLILGGHSKGGNLAEYAALLAEEELYKRIVKVFNHDGPSFLEEPSARISSDEYNRKLHKTIPAASPIGMILEERDTYHIVKSDGILVLQHEPFSWLIEGNDFIYKEKAAWENALFGSAFNRLIRESSVDDKEKLVETLYKLLLSTQTVSWAEYSSDIIKNSQHLLSESSNLDADTKQLLTQFVQQFLDALKDELFK